MTERFQPGGVTHALVSGLLELALAAALLAGSLAVSESSQGAAASVMNHCMPLVFGPLFAMQRRPARSCAPPHFSSANV